MMILHHPQMKKKEKKFCWQVVDKREPFPLFPRVINQSIAFAFFFYTPE
jgi:hypothetical protein